MGSGDSFLAGEQRRRRQGHMESRMCPLIKTRTRVAAATRPMPTDDGSSEEVIAMSQRTKHVHKKKRSKLKRNDSGAKTFPTSCCTVASGRGSLKRVQHFKTLKTINKARLPPPLFIGLS